MTEKISYENPDGTYDLAAAVVNIANARLHLQQYCLAHAEVALAEDSEGSDPDDHLPHAS